jgi:hypothetical protein
MMVTAALPSDPLALKVERLKVEQDVMRKERQRLASEIKNTMRKQSRLRKRARQMTDDDLVAVLMMRKDKRVEKAGDTARDAADDPKSARSDGAPGSSGSSSASLPPPNTSNQQQSDVEVELAAGVQDDANKSGSQEE